MHSVSNTEPERTSSYRNNIKGFLKSTIKNVDGRAIWFYIDFLNLKETHYIHGA